MKFVFSILVVFFISFAFKTQARDLSFREKTAVLNLEKTINVKKFMESNIALPDLPLSQYLSYKVLKNSCSPLISHVQKIKQEDSTFSDQTSKLSLLYGICSRGVIGLSEIFINNKL